MIDFDGTDLVIEDHVDDAMVRRALASALGVPEDRVLVIDDVSRYPERDCADVVALTSPVTGEFSRVLSVQATRQNLPYDEPLGPMQRVCEILNTRCLVPDDSPNPYRMWLVAPDETPRRVGLDSVALDEDRYVILGR